MTTNPSSIGEMSIAPKNNAILPLLGWLFIFGVMAQRFCVWVGTFPITLSILFVVLPPLVLWKLGLARLERNRVFLFFLMMLSLTLCTFINTETSSVTSYLIFLVLYFPFCFTITLRESVYISLQKRYAIIAAGFGLLGLLQYILQFVIPHRDKLFSWYWFVPSHYLIEYNSLNALGYQSSIFKSNGVFFLEASAVSQLLARTFLIGRYYNISPIWSIATLIGIAVTYSGGGMILIMAFILPLVIHEVWRSGKPNLKVLLPYIAIPMTVAMLALVLTQAGLFHYDTILGRASEINRPGTSGNARYATSIPVVMETFDRHGVIGLLFGIGAGQSTASAEVYGGFTVAWVKLIVEYGLLGLSTFVIFTSYSIWSSTKSKFITATLVLCFLCLDENLLVPEYVFFLMMLGTFAKRGPKDKLVVANRDRTPLPKKSGAFMLKKSGPTTRRSSRRSVRRGSPT